MSATELRDRALSLPIEDRMELADQLWASIQRDEAEAPLWPWQRVPAFNGTGSRSAPRRGPARAGGLP